MKKFLTLTLSLIFSCKIGAANFSADDLPPAATPLVKPSGADLVRVLDLRLEDPRFKGMIYGESPTIIHQARDLIDEGVDPRDVPLSIWEKLASVRPDVAGALLIYLRYSHDYVGHNSAAIMAALPREQQVRLRRVKLEADAKRAIEMALSTESDQLFLPPADTDTSITDVLAHALTTHTAPNTPAGTITAFLSNPSSGNFRLTAFKKGIENSAWRRRGTILVAQDLDHDRIAEAKASEAAAKRAGWQRI